MCANCMSTGAVFARRRPPQKAKLTNRQVERWHGLVPSQRRVAQPVHPQHHARIAAGRWHDYDALTAQTVAMLGLELLTFGLARRGPHNGRAHAASPPRADSATRGHDMGQFTEPCSVGLEVDRWGEGVRSDITHPSCAMVSTLHEKQPSCQTLLSSSPTAYGDWV